MLVSAQQLRMKPAQKKTKVKLWRDAHIQYYLGIFRQHDLTNSFYA